MKVRSFCMVAALVCASPAFAVECASAEVVLRVPVPDIARVPRIKPASPVKQYPFGLLRQDYTPYGMAGVPDRLYFDRSERARVVRHRHVVRAMY